MTYWDAIVIGGGPAGCCAGIQLANAGKKVLLIEKEAEAHHKVCGEFLSYETQHYLATLGIDLAALGAVPVNEMQLIHANHNITVKLPFTGMSLSRYQLDEALIQRAITSGVHVKRGVAVTALGSNHDIWTVACAKESYQSESVFLATGKRDLRNMPRAAGIQNNYIGFKMHWQLDSKQTSQLKNQVRIILFKGGYAGLELVENEIANLCLVITKSRFAALGKQWNLLLAAIRKEVPQLDACLSGAKQCWNQPLAVFGIPYGFVYNNRTDKGLYRIGDQMAVIPSFSGDGMAIALHTATCAVKAMLGNGTDYNFKIRKELLSQVRRASLVSLLTATSMGQRLAFATCLLFPSLLNRIVTSTRLKSFSIQLKKPLCC